MNRTHQQHPPFLTGHGFRRDDASRVWLPGTATSFDYSDGDEVEDRLLSIISGASDRSLFSAQLAAHQTDWASTYHLSPARANLLRPLESLLAKRRVLEIGAGCGAVTRYLGELGAEVLALEGSSRRATIAASRCRDLESVNVVNESLERLPSEPSFDVVTLIGVLEYARMYFSGPDGVDATLRHARSFLREGGILLVAIENQLGLKYFAGLHEDHLSRAMAGIQDHYAPNGVVTFGREELEQKILKAGFAECEFALPFPDYKLPGQVILPAGWSDIEGFDAATLAGQATRSDRQLTHPLLFSTSQAFAVARRNGLLADLSNSFLVLARATSAAPGFEVAAPGVLACHYSVDRAACYATSATIRRDDGTTTVVREPLVSDLPPPQSALLSQRVASEPYALGRHWVDELDWIVSRPGWTVADVAAWLSAWMEALAAHAREHLPSGTRDLSHELPGDLIDAIPRNLVRTADGRWVFFDQEWILKVPVTLGYLVFRALNVSLASVTCVAEPDDPRLLHVPTLFRACLHRLGFLPTSSDILGYLDFDAAFESEVHGRIVRPQTLDQYDGYVLGAAPDVTALLHGKGERLHAEVVARLSRLQDDLEAAQRLVDTLSTDIANSRMHVGVLEAKVGEETEARKAALAALSDQIRHAETLESEVARLQAAHAEKDSGIASLQAHMAVLEEHLNVSKAEGDRLLDEVQALGLQLESDRKDARRNHEDIAKLHAELATATQVISDKDNEIHRLWLQLDTHEQDSKETGQLAQDLHHDLALARQSLQSQEVLLAELASIKASTSWRLTSPLRVAKTQYRAFIRKLASLAGSGARRAYRSIPVPMHRKVALKGAIFRRMPALFSGTNAYRRWQADVATHAHDDAPYLPVGPGPGSEVQHAYLEQPELYVSDGIAEWNDYPMLKARIADAIRASGRQGSPKPVKMFDFTSQDLAKVAGQIELPAPPASPDVSIVIPAYNHAARTLECLASIAKHHDPNGPTFEVIVADDASTESSALLAGTIPHVRFRRQERNLGFLRNCNSAVEDARGQALLFLNNDVQVTSGWLTALWSVLKSDDTVGAVGPRIIYPSGWLQDAGTRLRRDGTGEMIGLNAAPDTASYTYDRDVDYCSGACLLLRRRDFLEAGGFDERFAPAYCEDSDLCMQLRERGLRIVFCADAEVVHHLSATSDSLPSDYKLSCISRNLDAFSDKWRRQLDELDSVRTIAFYLPQFHPFPENDLWWGEGFTEWTNVTKARPNYVGHYQPRVPADLGYYDLRVAEVMNKQAELARRYGVGGFCYYYYWFAGHRLLERPIERMLATGEPGFPFCLCWANENWTRRWDGQEHDVLMAQNHSDDDDLAVIEDLARYFRSKNYIRVNGRPLILVYRVTLFPDFARTSALWRRYCRENGIGEIYIAQVESFELVTAGIRPQDLGCDAAVEFPPQGMAEPRPPGGTLLNQNFVGAVADYHDVAVRYSTRELPPYKRFMGVMPGWDNTARRQNNSYIFERSTPGAFQAWLETVVKRTKQQFSGDERLIFINAWNEWAEGAYLEPDRRFGHSFLQAHLNALEAEHLMERKIRFPG